MDETKGVDQVENKVSTSDVFRLVEGSEIINTVRQIKKNTEDMQETMDMYDRYLQKGGNIITTTSSDKKEIFYKGYRPKFYLRKKSGEA